MIKIDGDLIELSKSGKFDVIVHGCNCFNSMGAGIAKAISREFFQSYVVDQQTKKGDYNKLGNYSFARIHLHTKPEKYLIVVNGYTQFGFDPAKRDQFEYDAFKLILKKLNYQYPSTHIGLPYIGCGLAGGDEIKIVGIMEEFSAQHEKTGGTYTLVKYLNKNA